MLNFVFQKIWNRKWLAVCLLLGNILMIAIGVAAPMYSHASLQRAMTQELDAYYADTGNNPGRISVTGNYRTNVANKAQAFAAMEEGKRIFDDMLSQLGISQSYRVDRYYLSDVSAKHEVMFEGDTSISLRLTSYSDVDEHIRITNGTGLSDQVKDNIIDVVVNYKTFVMQDMVLGEVLELPQIKDLSGKPYKIRIAGIIESAQSDDPYWINPPEQWNNTCLVDEDLFRELFMDPAKMNRNFQAQWYSILDYETIRADKAQAYLGILEDSLSAIDDLNIQASHSVNFQSVLEDFAPQVKKLNISITVMLLPVFVLLAAFILMICKQMLEMERDEIAVYKSRGADKKQILGIYLLQSLSYCIAGLLIGVPLGMLICKMLGASSSFMEFSNKEQLPIYLNLTSLLFAFGAMVICLCAMTLPVIRYARMDVLERKQKKNQATKTPLWQKLCLDLILLGVSIYGLYQFHSQKDYLVERIATGASADPLLFACSSLFMIGSALVVVRLFPLLIGLIFAIGKKWWSPSAYAALLGMTRVRGNRGFLMVFMCLTVSIGIFNAQTARTINSNAQDKILYSNGADVVFQEVWEHETAEDGSEGDYIEPDYSRFLSLDGIESITKVLVEEDVTVNVKKGKVSDAMVMGIHTREFGQTAIFDRSLFAAHPNVYLNAISQNAQAILVSSNFRDSLGYEVGDSLTYSNASGASVRGVIYGFVDYWPSYQRVVRTVQEDGRVVEMDKYLIVAHLSQLQKSWGITPYQVWINTVDSSDFIYDFAKQTSTRFSLFKDTDQDLENQNNEPLFQATNGILTVGFICILALCTMGFLVYWILSIQGRTLQFGILRAMGMSVKEVLSMLIGEQCMISGISIASGVGVGMLTSKFFVPLMQMAYSKADQVIPLKIVSSATDYIRLFVVIGLVMAVCLFVLGWLVSRIRISQALKLGED